VAAKASSGSGTRTAGWSATSATAASGRIDDPLVGRQRLWIANQICDLVQIRSGESGTQVRLQMAVDG